MFVKYIEDFLTKDECHSLIDLGCSMDLIRMKSSLIVNGELIGENLNYDGNKRMGGYFSKEISSMSLIKDISDRIIDLSNKLNPFKGISYVGIPGYSFNQYGAGDFLDWHPDAHEIINGATITYIIQLNDDYEGGNVKYMVNDTGYSVKKKTGSVFVFDSNIHHAVDTVISGLRYSINVWPSKEIKKTLL